ncbi:MAG: hypothetical protein WC728_03850 [Elusimicrobiota bacterium]
MDKDIAEIETQIEDAIVDKKAMGGIASVFASAREQALKHTKAMLDQKRRARLRGISLRYTVDGKPYKRPDDYEARFKILEQELLEQKVKLKKAEMRSDGSLFGALMGATSFMIKFNVSLLEAQRLFLKHDIPVYSLAQFQDQAKEIAVSSGTVSSPKVETSRKATRPARSASVQAKRKRAEILKLVGFAKEPTKYNYSNAVSLTLKVENKGQKRITAWKALLVAKNAFGEELLEVQLSSNVSDIAPGAVEDAPFVWEDNQFSEGEPYDKLMSVSDENLKLELFNEQVVFE